MSTSSSELLRPASFSTLTDALAAAPSERPFITMWTDEDEVRTISFGEFRLRAQCAAAHFRSVGLHKGDTVVLIITQGIELMSAFVGAMLAGAAPAILAYPNFKVEPEKYRLGLAGVSANLKARMVIVDEFFPQTLLDQISLTDETFIVTASPGDFDRTPVHPNSTLMSADDVAFIQHSAGTTGLQKGVALSHSAVLRQLDHLSSILEIGEQDRIYSWLPLYHDMGLIACFMLPMVCHLPVVMQSPTKWVLQPGTMLQLISDLRCTLAWVPNFTLQFLARRVHREDRENYDLSSLRAVINCSEPVRAQSMDEFIAAYESSGLRRNVLQSSYAMAENVFAVTQSDIHSQPRRLWVDGARLRAEHVAIPVSEVSDGAVCVVSSGKCLTGNEVRIASPEGNQLSDGSVGEILIRSDSLFEGYFNRPDLTEVSLRGGWYRSGDLGFCFEGELYVIGRKKDLIIVAGKNIYPQDIEDIVSAHPLIHDGRAIAFGLFNVDLGTEDVIVVGEVDEEANLAKALEIEREIRSAIVAELGVAVRSIYIKPPRWIVKSTAGKAARATTKEKLLREHPELAREDIWEKY